MGGIVLYVPIATEEAKMLTISISTRTSADQFDAICDQIVG